MNNEPTLSPAERLAGLSIQLNQGAEAWEADHQGGWLPAPLIAMIVTWIKEIAEAFAALAALLRDGKLVPPAPAAPRQGESPAGKPATLRPAPAAQVRSPRAKPEMAEPPATGPGPGQDAQILRPDRKPGPDWAIRPILPPSHPNPPSTRLASAHWPRVRPKPKTARTKPTPWHAHIVSTSKQYA